MIQLLQGNCLELMKNIPDGSVDMILCDLPYGTTDCKWDSVIPFEPLWEQYGRIVKDRGAIVLFGSEPFATRLRSCAIDLYKYDWIWHKTRPTGFVHAKNKPLKDYENIMVFSKGTTVHASQSPMRMTYNPQGLSECEVVKRGGRSKFGTIIGKRPSHRANYVQTATGYPRMVLQGYKVEGKYIHPTQKPVSLLEYLVRTYTNPGETVLDNCMGSGSTGVACVNTGRSFIGMELDEGYFKIASDRISAAECSAKRNNGYGEEPDHGKTTASISKSHRG